MIDSTSSVAANQSPRSGCRGTTVRPPDRSCSALAVTGSIVGQVAEDARRRRGLEGSRGELEQQCAAVVRVDEGVAACAR